MNELVKRLARSSFVLLRVGLQLIIEAIRRSIRRSNFLQAINQLLGSWSTTLQSYKKRLLCAVCGGSPVVFREPTAQVNAVRQICIPRLEPAQSADLPYVTRCIANEPERPAPTVDGENTDSISALGLKTTANSCVTPYKPAVGFHLNASTGHGEGLRPCDMRHRYKLLGC